MALLFPRQLDPDDIARSSFTAEGETIYAPAYSDGAARTLVFEPSMMQINKEQNKSRRLRGVGGQFRQTQTHAAGAHT